ncbi:MAG: 30S ribosomal protein S13 [Candidatus Nanoarchaeia archaeon]|jgi:small subunit ribosomal protein S13
MKRVVRIRKVDLPGEKKVSSAICRIKGINFTMSNALIHVLNINGDTKLGELSDEDIERLRIAIESPKTIQLPAWLLNRRKDVETGSDVHLTGIDIALKVREDVKQEQELKSRRGFRLAAGLKVRGQRTKAHPRRGKTVGVVTKKKAAKMQKKTDSPKKEEKKGGAKKK